MVAGWILSRVDLVNLEKESGTSSSTSVAEIGWLCVDDDSDVAKVIDFLEVLTAMSDSRYTASQSKMEQDTLMNEILSRMAPLVARVFLRDYARPQTEEDANWHKDVKQ